jgi:hypothetical protein
MAKIEITQPPSGTVNEGVLQVLGGGAVTATTKTVTDQLGTLSALQVSTATVSVTPGGVLYGSAATLSVRAGGSGVTFEAISSAGTGIFQANDGGQVNVPGKFTVGPSLSTPPSQSICLTTVASTDNLRNFVGKNISDTAGLQPFKVNGGRARGTSTTQTAVQTNDGLASFNGFGHNGTDWTSTRGGMYIYAAENWGLLANGTYITWRGAATGTTIVSEWARLQSTGLTISTISNATTDTDKFLVSDSGVIKYRTGTELLSDLGISNPVTGTGAATRVAFWSSTSEISSSIALNWDNTNGYLGVNTASPVAQLQVKGNANAGNNVARFETQGLVNLFTLSEEGKITAFAPQINALSGTTEINKFTSSFFALSGGSGSFRPLSIAYTINNVATQTGTATGIFLSATDTALGGMTHNLIDLQAGSSPTSRFRVTSTAASVSITSNGVSVGNTVSATDFSITSKLYITSPANGVATISNATSADFVRLQLGGTTASFPALARSSTSVIVTLADATAGASLGVGMASATGVVASAVLQADSTTKGFLPPRMTTAQKNGIVTPATGLVVYDTTLNKLAVYTSAAWETVTSV